MAAAFGGLGLHAATPGPAGSMAPPLPAELRRAAGLPAGAGFIAMFVHPQCPCTPAGVDELAAVLEAGADRAVLMVVFSPRRRPVGWSEVAVVDLARRLPGASCVEDPDGHLAELAGAGTSGHVLVVDPDDRCLFAGGVTAARGHTGSNDSSRSLQAVLAGVATAARRPVFGCAMAEDRR
ncbi:MAG: hypothetical protein AB7O97_17625 [Planctomycetota bacterium]